jgi:hypothetical protein
MSRTYQVGDKKVNIDSDAALAAVQETNILIKENLAKMNLPNYAAAKDYSQKLLQISSEYIKTIKAADDAALAQSIYADEPDIDLRFNKLKPTQDAFKALQGQLGSQKTLKLINIPPLPTTQDFKNTPETELVSLTNLYNKLTATRNKCMILYSTIENTQVAISDNWTQEAAKKQRNQADGAVYPAPSAQASQQPARPPLSSSHGAQYQQSQAQADANRRVGAGSQQPNNANAKSKSGG